MYFKLFAAALVLAMPVSTQASHLRFLVDTPDILAGDWFFDERKLETRRPDRFDRLPSFEGVRSDLEAGIRLEFDGVEFVNGIFSTTEDADFVNMPNRLYFYNVTFENEAPPFDIYTNAPQGASEPVEFGIYNVDKSYFDNLFSGTGQFSGRFCFALQGTIAGGVTEATCDTIIDNAIAAIPIPASLPLAATALALLAGLGARRRS